MMGQAEEVRVQCEETLKPPANLCDPDQIHFADGGDRTYNYLKPLPGACRRLRRLQKQREYTGSFRTRLLVT